MCVQEKKKSALKLFKDLIVSIIKMFYFLIVSFYASN